MKTIVFLRVHLLLKWLNQKWKTTVLVFHKPSTKSFEKVVCYLKKRYNIISLHQYIDAVDDKTTSKLPNYSLVITIDDGHKSNYDLLPIIKKHNVPLTIFLTAGIVGTNRHFWFNKKDIVSSVDLKKLSNETRLKLMKGGGFTPQKEFSNPEALTKEQITEMKPYVDFQSHTVFHPILPTCTDEESRFEIFESKRILEEEFGLNINSIAYPNGDYTEREISYCKEAGYKMAFTTELGFNSSKTHPYKIKRIGTNDTENLNEFILRVSGAWFLIKRLLFLK